MSNEIAADMGQEMAVIDIGSNSVRLVIYQTYGAHFTPVFNEKVLAGLGRDLRATGRLSETGKQVCLQALLRFQRIVNARKISKLLIGATAALRVAQDAKDYLAEIKARTGLDITPISGAEEARLSAMGVIAADTRHDGIAADLGGASLELVKVADRKVGEALSLPLGPFDVVGGNLRDVTTEEFEALRDKIDEALKDLPKALRKTKTLYLIGGAWRNLASVHQQRMLYPMRTLQDYALSADAARSLAEWAYHDGRTQLLDWAGMRKARAETLPYSGVVLERLIAKLNPKQVIVSTAGLREGLVYDALSAANQGRDALYDGCRDFAYGALQAEDFAEPLLEFVSPLLKTLPKAFQTHNEDYRLIKAACLLAGLGKNLHPDYRAELVFNDVLYAPVAGLNHRERAFLALALFRSYSHKRDVPNARAIETLLTDEQQDIACIVGEMIRLGVVITGRSGDLLPIFQLRLKKKVLVLSVEPQESALITDQVVFRLERLGKLLGFSTEVDTHKA